MKGGIQPKKQILSQPESLVKITKVLCGKIALVRMLKHRASLVFLGWVNFPQNILKEKFWPTALVGGHLKIGKVEVVAEARRPIPVLEFHRWDKSVAKSHGNASLGVQLLILNGTKMVANCCPGQCLLIGKLFGKKAIHS